MGSLAQAKTLGGVGSILVLLSIVPQAGMILGLVGLILVLVAVKYMLISVILTIAGLIIAAVFVFASLFAFFGEFIFRPLPEPSMFIGPRLFGFLTTLLYSISLVRRSPLS